ncbi:MAG TPA: DUF4133 domain-containing protein [Chitinophagaceae bacterium]|jgi:hypothetical protein|nr:DUF4133 domain-containing protein [Chitinophagaceae bacterium]
MGNSIYKINKGINKSIEFRGLKAQYIWYLGGGVLILLLVFALLYFTGINTFVCVGGVLAAGALLVIKVYQLSNKYGEHGMMKAAAGRKIPKVIRSYSRKIFMQMRQ